jgi:hypothetical protein
MLACVAWVELHWLKPLVLLQHSTSPFPSTTKFTLTSKLVAMRGHRYWVPVLEAYVRTFKVGEQLMRRETSDCARGTIYQRFVWWRLLNAVVDKMTGCCQKTLAEYDHLNLPIHCWNHLAESILKLVPSKLIGILIDTFDLLHGWDATI